MLYMGLPLRLVLKLQLVQNAAATVLCVVPGCTCMLYCGGCLLAPEPIFRGGPVSGTAFYNMLLGDDTETGLPVVVPTLWNTPLTPTLQEAPTENTLVYSGFPRLGYWPILDIGLYPTPVLLRVDVLKLSYMRNLMSLISVGLLGSDENRRRFIVHLPDCCWFYVYFNTCLIWYAFNMLMLEFYFVNRFRKWSAIELNKQIYIYMKDAGAPPPTALCLRTGFCFILDIQSNFKWAYFQTS